MSDDELDNLTDKIGGGGEEGMGNRLEDTEVGDVGNGDDKEPDELVEDLKDDDPETGAEAADELERLAEEEPEELEEYEDDLIEALEIDDNWAKRAAASALAEVGSEDALEELEDVEMPEADDAAEKIRERHDIETEDETDEEEAAVSTADGGMESTGDEDAGRALDAAKNGDADVDFSEIVLLQMLESDKDEPSKYAEQSLRHAIREYPDTALELTEDFADRLVDDADDLRRYASLVMHEVSEEYVDEARDHVSQLVDSLGDDDEDVSQRGEEALTNVAEEYPDDVVGTVAQKSQDE
ncbi:MAG: HEAT repeat domain-containing protein [Halobacteriales archaeon]